LIRDIGRELDSAAHMVELVREKQMQFVLGKDTLEVEDLSVECVTQALEKYRFMLAQKMNNEGEE